MRHFVTQDLLPSVVVLLWDGFSWDWDVASLSVPVCSFIAISFELVCIPYISYAVYVCIQIRR